MCQNLPLHLFLLHQHLCSTQQVLRRDAVVVQASCCLWAAAGLTAQGLSLTPNKYKDTDGLSAAAMDLVAAQLLLHFN